MHFVSRPLQFHLFCFLKGNVYCIVRIKGPCFTPVQTKKAFGFGACGSSQRGRITHFWNHSSLDFLPNIFLHFIVDDGSKNSILIFVNVFVLLTFSY